MIDDRLLLADGLIAFPTIPQQYTHLQVVLSGRGNAAVTVGDVLMRLNGDAGANYDYERHNVNAGATTVSEALAQTSAIVGLATGTTGTAARGGMCEILIPDYRGTTFEKDMTVLYSAIDAANTRRAGIIGAHWRSAAAINAMTLDFNAIGTGWKAGTRATLLGL